jgi:arabinose-5-phosphate isomerase
MENQLNQRLKKVKAILNDFTLAIQKISVSTEYSQAIDLINKCQGKIVTTGMGKAGIAMQKFSCTLCSFGIPSCYLHPGEAAHGNLGIISQQDIMFVASTSGKTREVLETISQSRLINSQPIIGITSHPDSPLRNMVNVVLDMGIIEEAGELKIAPTTSILVMLAITDSIAITLAEERGLTKEQFGRLHHGGYLGQKARGDSKIY